MYYDIAKSLIFAGRNNNKVFNQNDQGRIFAEAGQLGNAVSSVAKLDNAVGKGTKAAVDVFCKAAENNKTLDVIGKGVDFAKKNVNPLLCGAALYRVAKADDKEKALKKEIWGMGTMFTVEELMKTGFNSAAYKNFVESINNPTTKAVLGIAQGAAFVLGSITASTTGYAIGERLTKSKNKKQSNIKNKVKLELHKTEKTPAPKFEISKSDKSDLKSCKLVA